MPGPKRMQRIDSIQGQIAIYLDDAEGPPCVPDHVYLPPDAQPYWQAIVCARTNRDWQASPTLLATAANLAFAQWRMDLMRRAMMVGEIFEEMKPKELQLVITKMASMEMAYLRTLQQHAAASFTDDPATLARRKATILDVKAQNPLKESRGLLASPKRKPN
jgi:hypothetical protein